MAVIGFSKHGKGGGKGVGDYLMNPNMKGRENNPPECIRGDIDATVALIDSIDNKWKYTSGMVSFEEETITPEQEQKIMDLFEEVAFAGLEKEQYDISWVRHTHAGHAELHFVTPRLELSTGKALNIKPPGELAKDTFDDLRSLINADMGFSDPDDPSKKRLTKEPSWELKRNAQLKREGKPIPESTRDILNRYVQQQYDDGFIHSRDDVVKALKGIGCEIPREGANYITAEFENEKIRLKGALYEREWHERPERKIEKTHSASTRKFGERDEKSVWRFRAKVARHMDKRADFNRKRYPLKNEVEPKARHMAVADINSLSLGDYIRNQLGHGAYIGRTSPDIPRAESPTRTVGARSGFFQVAEPNHGFGNIKMQGDNQDRGKVDVVRQSGQQHGVRERLFSNQREVKNDKTGTGIIERIKAVIERTKQAFSNLGNRIRSISNDTERLSSACGKLDQSLRQFNHSFKQIEPRALRQASREIKKDQGRGFGPSR